MGRTRTIYEGKRVIALVLKGIGLAAAVGTVVVAPGSLAVYDAIIKQYDKRKGKTRLGEYLQKSDYLSITKCGANQFVITLSEKGKRRLKIVELEAYDPLPKKHKWDGRWHLLMFDVSESHKSVRDYLTRCIKEMNLAPVQDSVYAYPYPLEELARVIRVRFPGAAKHVISLCADRIDGSDQLKKHFIKIL